MSEASSLHAVAEDWRASPITRWTVRRVSDGAEVGTAVSKGGRVVVQDGSGHVFGSWPGLHAALRGMEDTLRAAH